MDKPVFTTDNYAVYQDFDEEGYYVKRRSTQRTVTPKTPDLHMAIAWANAANFEIVAPAEALDSNMLLDEQYGGSE
jgi:hypothetical protein